MSLDQFLSRFGEESEPAMPLEDQWHEGNTSGALDAFINKFNGVTEPYFFYDGKVELRFQVDEHKYYKVGELGQLEAQDGVTTICHIIDKSSALVPWSAKMVVEKLLRLIPTVTTEVISTWLPSDEVKPGQTSIMLAPMSLEAFTKIALEAKSAPRDKVEEAGDIGHMAHDWLEYYIKSIIARDRAREQGNTSAEIEHQQAIESKLLNLPKDERAANCVKAALDWMQKHNVRWIETERKIYSLKYGFAGTMDGLALVDSCGDLECKGCRGETFKDRLSVIDWKSSNYLYVEYLYQTAAYEAAYEEEFDVDVLDRWIIRLGKTDGEFDPWHTTTEDFQEDFEGFLDALSLHRSVKMTKERMSAQKKAAKEVKKVAKEAAKLAEKEQRKTARAALTAERRAKKAQEKELAKQQRKEERAALKKMTTSGPVMGHVHTLPEQPVEIKNAQIVEVDFGKVEERVVRSFLPTEQVTSYKPTLPKEA